MSYFFKGFLSGQSLCAEWLCVWREAEQSKALQRGAVGLPFHAVVISPETSEQVKASEGGREAVRLKRERGRVSISKRACWRIMRNDTTVAGKRLTGSPNQTHSNRTDGISRLNSAALHCWHINVFVFISNTLC